jgi:Alg9-like mannosyltransferase family
LCILHRLFFIPLSFLRIPEVLEVWERRIRKNQHDQSSLALLRENFIETTWLPFLLPALGFVTLYSGLGHKEVRFLFPVLPLFNMTAAVGLSRLHDVTFPMKGKKSTFVSRLGYFVAATALISSFFTSGAFVAVSRLNYPGGSALHMLKNHVYQVTKSNASIEQRSPQVHVHIDVASAMTGVSLFGQRSAQMSNPKVKWSFAKDGYEMNNSNAKNTVDWSTYTHLLSESSDATQSDQTAFFVVGAAQGNPRIDIRRGALATTDAVYILERPDWLE